MSQSTTDFSDWIGRREEASDVATLSSVAGMIATLDRDDGAPQIGDPLPPLWHWMYFAPRERHSGIGPDGHPRRGGFMPPIPLPRRMFAGGRATFHAPIRIGDEVRREGEITGVTRKDGRTGELVFVTVGYRILTDRGLAIEEEHDIVYRDAPTPGQQAASQAPVKADARDGDWRRTVAPDPVMLFRYSALTFNGHRIHYDHPYVTGVEGYPGLVVHGPLIATLLADLARDESGRQLRRFAFRAKRPLFDTAPFTVSGRMGDDGRTCTVAAITPDGAVAMAAEVELA